MEKFVRLENYRVKKDFISAYLCSIQFEIQYFTHWPDQQNKQLKNRITPFIKVVLVEQGEMEIELNGKAVTLLQGDCLIIPPFTLYCSRSSQKFVNTYEIFFNVYPITREQEFLQQLKLDGIFLYRELLSQQDFFNFIQCYQAIVSNKQATYLQLNAYLTILFVKIIQQRNLTSLEVGMKTREQALIEKVFLYLNEHLNEAINVESICQQLSISQSYLYRCCKHVVGCSTVQMITRHKMIRAQQLLKDPDSSVNQVATKLGYESVYYFSNLFKKNFMLSPSEFRRNFTSKTKK